MACHSLSVAPSLIELYLSHRRLVDKPIQSDAVLERERERDAVVCPDAANGSRRHLDPSFFDVQVVCCLQSAAEEEEEEEEEVDEAETAEEVALMGAGSNQPTPE